MNNDYNVVLVEGIVKNDVELFSKKSGGTMCKFTIENREDVYIDGEEETISNFLTITAWGALAKTAQKILKKYDKVRIQGSIYQNTWLDKDGIETSNLYITARDISLYNDILYESIRHIKTDDEEKNKE